MKLALAALTLVTGPASLITTGLLNPPEDSVQSTYETLTVAAPLFAISGNSPGSTDPNANVAY